MTVSNKWTKLLQSLVGTEDVKYIAAVRCAMEQGQLFNDKSYATMKFAFVKTLVKKQKKLCDDYSMDGIDPESPNMDTEAVRKMVRQWANAESRATYETHQRTLLWNEEKYLAAVGKSRRVDYRLTN